METEMTNELKAKFFVQYWNQNVFHRDDLVFHNEPVNANSLQFIEDSYLGLRNLSSITDEDAIEVAKILYPGYKGEWQVCDKGAALLKLRNNKGSMLIIWKDLSGQYGVNDLDYYLLPRVVDYLRSKGYALPFMGISVEQQVKSGWVKLVENTELTELPDKPLTECMMGRDGECNHPQCPVTDEDEKNGRYCTLPLYDYRE